MQSRPCDASEPRYRRDRHVDWQQTYIEVTDANAAEHGASSAAFVVLQSTVPLTVADLPARRRISES